MTQDIKDTAIEMWQAAHRLHMAGDLDRAIALYTRSITLHPTAEAYTFRGWAYSHQGLVREAIADCEKAIESDPSFGNPYNDIGAYLIALDELDDAIPWFEKAKKAERYEARHFPYLNLARIYALRGQVLAALGELDGALEEQPGEAACLALRQQLRGRLN
jgi:tetratricopeptide (TPR) repeat protein